MPHAACSVTAPITSSGLNVKPGVPTAIPMTPPEDPSREGSNGLTIKDFIYTLFLTYPNRRFLIDELVTTGNDVAPTRPALRRSTVARACLELKYEAKIRRVPYLQDARRVAYYLVQKKQNPTTGETLVNLQRPLPAHDSGLS